MSEPPIRAVIGLPPEETVRAFEARDQLRTTVHWSEMYHADHARAFTVAKVAKLDLLAEIQASLADVMANGGTFEQWQANLVPYLKKQGWWGDVTDPALTGTTDLVRVGSSRLRTIYDTNLRVSRAAGRWSRIQDFKRERPFLRYTAVLDARTRPAHRAWHGTILPVDHEWWDTHFPPCGWYCRCTVRQLSQRDLDAEGWSVTGAPPAGPPQTFYPVGSTTPIEVPAGISPGFGYNPGKAAMGAIADKAVRSIEAAAVTDLAAARSTLNELVQSDAFDVALSDPSTVFPAMVLSDSLKAALDAPSAVVTISGDDYSVILGQNGMTVPVIQQLPAVGADPAHVLATDSEIVMIGRTAHGRQLHALLQRRAAGLMVANLSWITNDALASLLASGTDLLAALGGGG